MRRGLKVLFLGCAMVAVLLGGAGAQVLVQPVTATVTPPGGGAAGPQVIGDIRVFVLPGAGLVANFDLRAAAAPGFPNGFGFLDDWYDFRWVSLITTWVPAGGAPGFLGALPAIDPQPGQVVPGALPNVPGGAPNVADDRPHYYNDGNWNAGVFGPNAINPAGNPAAPTSSFQDMRLGWPVGTVITFETYLVVQSTSDMGIAPHEIVVLNGFRWTHTAGAAGNVAAAGPGLAPNPGAVTAALANSPAGFPPPGGAGTPGWSALPSGAPPAGRTLSECPRWQHNTPKADLQLGAAPPLTQPGPVRGIQCVGQPGTLDVNSTQVGLGWEMGVSVLPAVPGDGGGVHTMFGQVFNLDFSDPALAFLNGLMFPPFPGAISIGVNIPVPTALTLQSLHLDPGIGDGFALSAPNELVVAPNLPLTGPTGDDESLEVYLPCGGFPVGFCGVAYDSIWVNANGNVTFGGPSGDFSPSVAEFSQGLPRLAAMWTDLSPNVAGTITTSLSSGVVQVSWSNVPEFGSPTTANSVDLDFEPAGGCAIRSYAPDAFHSQDTLVGLSCGNGAQDPGPQTLAALVGAGPQTNGPQDMVYEFAFGQPVPPGFNEVFFPLSDPTLWLVN